mmetsp:Transcript_19219/g.41876  ORF Transcript_19219/g.41876 Transcript_19219/m.41876 type:complete len:241 (+) Transcript_19219:589-1311(+)
MCTRPSAVGPSGRLTVTKRPKGAILATLPGIHSEGGTSAKAVMSTASLGPLSPPAPSGFMERLRRPAPASTLITRTCTSWPTSTSSSVFSTKPSLIWVMCTRPSTGMSLPGGVTETKRPKGAARTTVPVIHSEGDAPTKPEMSAGPRGPEAPSLSFIMVRESLPSSLISFSQTSISCPSLSQSSTLSTRVGVMAEMCTRPSSSAPMSTKAPKGAMERTVPVNFCPTSSSSSLSLRGRMRE